MPRFRLLHVLPLLALLAPAGCRSSSVSVSSRASALTSCNPGVPGDCTVPAGSGSGVTVGCVANACTPLPSAAGCISSTDCNFNNGCTVGTCVAGTCVFGEQVDGGVRPGCCTATKPCSASASACQNPAACDVGSCTFTAKAKSGVHGECCNSTADCSPTTGVSGCDQTTNSCVCTDGSKTYCDQVTSGSHCVTGTQCCQDSDCTGTQTCNDGTCACPGTQHFCGGACHECCAAADCTGTLDDPTCQKWACSGGGNGGSCSVAVKSGATCCSSASDCGTGVTCPTTGANANQCTCATAGDTFCPGATTGTGSCCGAALTCDGTAHACTCPAGSHSCDSGQTCTVAGVTSCGSSCVDCTSGESMCQTGSCSSTASTGSCSTTVKSASGCCTVANTTNCVTGTCQSATCNGATNICGVTSTGAPGCCNSATVIANCGNVGAVCTNNVCDCGANKRYCTSTNGGPACIASTLPACCVAGDCASVTNGVTSCTSHACGFTCNGGYHKCGSSCQPDSSTTECGVSCVICPVPMNLCQSTVCTGGACGYTKTNVAGCCNPATVATDCTTNQCQTSACTNNQCIYTAKNVAGCCTTADNCPAPIDPCIKATCTASQCGTTPIAGCHSDGGVPDMRAPVDMARAPDLGGGDMSVAQDLGGDLALPDLSTPRDLAAPGQQTSLTGGGGCAVGGDGAPAGMLLLGAFTLFAALRRRHE